MPLRRFLILLVITGCVRVPECELGEIATTCGCDSVADSALDSGNFQAGDFPSQTWWKEFNDPVLTKLIEQALESSPTLMRAEAKMKAAAQKALQKKAALYPEVSFDPTDTWQHFSKTGFFRTYAPTIPAMVNDILITLTFKYEFDFWGKYRDLFKAELGEALARTAELRQAELILSTSIAYTYAELQYLLLKKQLLDQQGTIRANIMDIRAKREQNALDTALVHLTSQSGHLDIRALLKEVDPQISQHIHKLKALAGLDQDALLDVPYNALQPLQVALPQNLSLDLIARRPDLAALKARVEAAAKRISAAKTDFYPNVNLLALVGLESVFWSKIFRNETYSGTLTPALHLPIFTAGRLRAQLMEQVADFNNAVFAYNELILQATQNIADALTAIIFLQQEIEVRASNLQVAQKQAELTRKRMEHAIDDRISYLEAQYTALEAELLLAALEYGKQLEGILLIRELGGGYCGTP